MRRAARELRVAATQFERAAQHDDRAQDVLDCLKALVPPLNVLCDRLGKPRGKSLAELSPLTLRRQVRNFKHRLVVTREAAAAKRKELEVRLAGRITTQWLIRAGLSEPSLSLRTVTAFLGDYNLATVAPADTLSHASVATVRDAFGEVLRNMNRQAATAFLNSSPSFVIVRHLHDEAGMRLRSICLGEPEGDARLPRRVRSRVSKIQNNVVSLHRGPGPADAFHFVLELQPLAKKDSPTLATALRLVLQQVEACAGAPAGDTHGDAQRHLVHVIVGDGVSSNQLATRLLWTWRTREAGGLWSYRVLLLRCSTHQANLCVKTAVCGDASPDKSPLPGCCVRFFKYLMPEKGEDLARRFRHTLAQWVPSVEQSEELGHLQTVYGKHVLPDDLLQAARGDRSVGNLDVLESYLLHCQDKPVMTRFFLFTNCVFTLFRMVLLVPNLSTTLLGDVSDSLRNQTKRRLCKCARYLCHHSTRTQLGIACLCLQMTLKATALTGQRSDSSVAGADDPRLGAPVLVQLANGALAEEALAMGESALSTVWFDKKLLPDMSQCLVRLLTTAGQLWLRFQQYQQYPARCVLMCEKFHEAWVDEILRFLSTPAAALDAGYSLVLQKEAWRAAGGTQSEADALAYMQSEAVQQELETIATSIEARAACALCPCMAWSVVFASHFRAAGFQQTARNGDSAASDIAGRVWRVWARCQLCEHVWRVQG